VTEVSNTGQDHRHAVLIRGGDDLGISDRSSGLDNGGHSRPRGGIHPIAERKERI
jgi:hypothetical protein